MPRIGRECARTGGLDVIGEHFGGRKARHARRIAGKCLAVEREPACLLAGALGFDGGQRVRTMNLNERRILHQNLCGVVDSKGEFSQAKIRHLMTDSSIDRVPGIRHVIVSIQMSSTALAEVMAMTLPKLLMKRS